MSRAGLIALEALLVLVLLAALVIGQPGDAQDSPPSHVDVVLVWGTGPIFREMEATSGPAMSDLLRQAIDQARADLPGALIIDAGRWTVPNSVEVSVLNHPSTLFQVEEKYDLVNVTAYDYSHFGARANTGLNDRMGEENESIYVSSISRHRQHPRFVPTRMYLDAPGTKVTVASVSDPGHLSAVPMMYQEAVAASPGEVLLEAAAFAEGPFVLFSDYDAESNTGFAATYPRIDVLVETAHTNADPIREGHTWRVGRPEAGALRHLRLTIDENGRVGSLEVRDRPWTSATALSALEFSPTPEIGRSVTPQGRIEQLLDVDPGVPVQFEVHYDSEFDDLTYRRDIVVYQIQSGGVRYRLYRVYQHIGRGYFRFDGLVILNPDRTIRQIYTHDPYWRWADLPTPFGEVLQSSIYGVPPSEWNPDPAQLRGYEEAATMMLNNLRRTIALDEILYPDSEGAFGGTN